MIKQFPEIAEFFKKSQFNEDDLRALVERVDRMYLDRSENLNAKAFIKLEMLKFEMLAEENKGKQNKKGKRSNTHNEEREQVADNPVRQKNKQMFIKERLNLISKSSYGQAAEILGISFDLLARIMNKRLVVKSEDLVDAKVFSLLKEYASKRLERLYVRQLKKIDSSKTKKKPAQKHARSSTYGVYDKLQTYGMRGKLIYIRKST